MLSASNSTELTASLSVISNSVSWAEQVEQADQAAAAAGQGSPHRNRLLFNKYGGVEGGSHHGLNNNTQLGLVSNSEKAGVRTVIENILKEVPVPGKKDRHGEDLIEQFLVQATSTYQVTRKCVPKVVAERKKWKKFGECSSHKPGIDSSTTMVGDEIKIQFTRKSSGEEILNENLDTKIEKAVKMAGVGGSGAGIVFCRNCKQNDHFTTNCPYKDIYSALKDNNADDAAGGGGDGQNDTDEVARKRREGKYIPPSVAAGKTASTFSDRRDENTVRVTNLPDDASEEELRKKFKEIGDIERIYIALDKVTKRCKGFAFVTYKTREHAAQAVVKLQGLKYEYSILKVECAKPN